METAEPDLWVQHLKPSSVVHWLQSSQTYLLTDDKQPYRSITSSIISVAGAEASRALLGPLTLLTLDEFSFVMALNPELSGTSEKINLYNQLLLSSLERFGV